MSTLESLETKIKERRNKEGAENAISKDSEEPKTSIEKIPTNSKKYAFENLRGKSKLPQIQDSNPSTISGAIRVGNAIANKLERAVEKKLEVKIDETPVLQFNVDDSELVDSDLEFDEYQKAAIDGVLEQKYACLIGAAGTGKTTCTKAVVASIQHYLRSINLSSTDDPHWMPNIVMCAFTGRATEQIKNNFPKSWHRNIMTIHSMLEYHPEMIDGLNDDGELVTKRIFVPGRTSENPLPYDMIIIDEAGMLAIDLWNNITNALPLKTRILMIGDINQLPPVHGRSIFGFAMTSWPVFELKKIHRQKGTENPIIDNAWRILRGEMPIKDSKRFLMLEVEDHPIIAASKLKNCMVLLSQRGAFDPTEDVAIVATNGKPESQHPQLGAEPINDSMAAIFNPDGERYRIDGGFEIRMFAVGDKVMATKNDRQIGLTNGMTGLITEINENGEYSGSFEFYGKISEISDKNRQPQDSESMIDLAELAVSEFDPKQRSKEEEKIGRGQSSHVVTVNFGDVIGEIPFATKGAIGSLKLAYAITCHKSQGGEYDTVIVMVHAAHKIMLYREWLYTAVTRAKKQLVLMYTTQGLAAALRKQKIKGSTTAEKVASFQKLQETPGIKAPELPKPERLLTMTGISQSRLFKAAGIDHLKIN